MSVQIFKEVSFDASHRLLHYEGKCHNLHGHRWKVEVWIRGEIEQDSKILVDYNVIKQIVERYDHQIILNQDDPMVARIREFHEVITTPGDPTSELFASLLMDSINNECAAYKRGIYVEKIRVWESPTCYAELTA